MVFRTLHRLLDVITYAGWQLAKVCVFLMMAILAVSTVGRYLFQAPLSGVLTINEIYLMIGLVFLSAPRLQQQDGNISVDLFSRHLPEWVRQVVHLTTRLAVVTILAVVVWGTGNVAWDRWATGASTQGAYSFPTFYSWIMVPLGFGILMLVFVSQMGENVRNLYEEVRFRD